MPTIRSSIFALSLSLTLLAASRPARADFPDKAFYIGIFGGYNLKLRDWDLGGAEVSARRLTTDSSGIVGGRLGLHVHSRVAIEAEVGWLPMTPSDGSINTVLAYNLDLLFHLLRGNWTPTIALGFGGYHAADGTLGRDIDPRFHVGLGLRGLLTRWVALRIDIRDVISDGFDELGSNNLEMTAGLDFFAWQGTPDRDKDGVADQADDCPDNAGPANTKGCPDADSDGIADREDRCPQAAGPEALGGCPDKDKDNVADIDDQCVDVPAGAKADPAKRGCPLDTDGDTVIDETDQCVDVAQGKIPDPNRAGCPKDTDGDGVIDEADQCVDVAAGKYPDGAKKGCPADRDGDGVIDEKDACIDVPAGKKPDANRPGCPSDKDKDTVADEVDACPDKAGAPDPDPKKNGCPGLVKVEEGKIVILQEVYFAFNKDAILPKSFPVLTAVINAIKSLPAGRHIHIEGHTDNKGKPDFNLDLSDRRAKSVMRYLAEHGIPAERLEAKGYGETRPVADNKNEKGRAKNRRVEFKIMDASGAAAPEQAPPAPAPSQAPAPEQAPAPTPAK